MDTKKKRRRLSSQIARQIDTQPSDSIDNDVLEHVGPFLSNLSKELALPPIDLRTKENAQLAVSALGIHMEKLQNAIRRTAALKQLLEKQREQSGQ